MTIDPVALSQALVRCPSVTPADAGALALKSGNVAILRGGSDSIRSSGAIQKAMAEGLKAAGLPETAIQVVKTTVFLMISILTSAFSYANLY